MQTPNAVGVGKVSIKRSTCGTTSEGRVEAASMASDTFEALDATDEAASSPSDRPESEEAADFSTLAVVVLGTAKLNALRAVGVRSEMVEDMVGVLRWWVLRWVIVVSL